MPPTFYDFSLIPIFSLSRYCPTLFNTTILIINGTKYVARRYNNKIDAVDTPLTKSSKTIKNANSAAPIPDTLGNAFAIRFVKADNSCISKNEKCFSCHGFHTDKRNHIHYQKLHTMQNHYKNNILPLISYLL